MSIAQDSLHLTLAWLSHARASGWHSATIRHSGQNQHLEQQDYLEQTGARKIAFDAAYSGRLLSGFGTLEGVESSRLRLSNPFDMLCWLVCREGQLTIGFENEQPVQLAAGTQQLFYLPGEKTAEFSFTSVNASFYLLLVGSSFFRYFLADDGMLQAKIKASDKASPLLDVTESLHPHQYALINELQYCNRLGPYKRIFTASKAIEMLLLLQELPDTASPKRPHISQELQQRMELLRITLDQDLKLQPTLAELARQVGTNVFTFKQAFKALFGTTVFAYHQSRKMESALLLLRQKEMRIGEISDLLGYKNQQHFSVAFKKYFGMRPSDVK